MMQYPPKLRLNIIFASVIILIIFYEGLQDLTDRRTMASYYSDVGDVLPSVEDPSFSPKTKSIFFHDTSYYGRLTAWQACAVEAAARVHPQWQVYVLFSSPVTHQALNKTCLADLIQFNNVKFARVHLAEFSKGTIVESILVNDLKDSKFPIQHSADILRILTLNKWGGIHLDTDMVVVRSFEKLPANWIVKKGENFLTTGILGFAKDEFGSNLTNYILKEIFETYDPNDWSITGRRAVRRAIQRICPFIISRIDDCKGLAFLPYELFYPTPHMLWQLYFGVKQSETYTFHLWNFLSKRVNVKLAPYELAAKKYCPTVFGLHGDKFVI